MFSQACPVILSETGQRVKIHRRCTAISGRLLPLSPAPRSENKRGRASGTITGNLLLGDSLTQDPTDLPSFR